jgi:hypothetical protein
MKFLVLGAYGFDQFTACTASAHCSNTSKQVVFVIGVRIASACLNQHTTIPVGAFSLRLDDSSLLQRAIDLL